MPFDFDKELLMKFLKEHEDNDFTFSDLANEFSVTVPTISKSAQILEAEGRAMIRIVGNAKLVKAKADDNG